MKTEYTPPSFLTNAYDKIVCTNEKELNYVLEWAKQNDKIVSKQYYKVKKFPYYLFLSEKIVGWSYLTDRIGKKFTFLEFINSTQPRT